MPTETKPTKPLVTRLQERAMDFRANLPHNRNDANLLEEAIAEIFRLERIARPRTEDGT